MHKLRRVDISYAFWCLSLLGVCGVQRFYNRRPISGIIYLFTAGLCGIGQLLDLFLIPGLVDSANAPLLPKEQHDPIEHQLLQLARRSGPAGFSINDAVLALEPRGQIDTLAVRAEIDRLLHADLLDVSNNHLGRVVYREP